MQGRIEQSVTFRAADTYLAGGPGVANSTSSQSHKFVEIDDENISSAILLTSADSRRVVVSYY